MRTEKGLTLISVTIYIIVMLIIVSVITVLTSYFYKNVNIQSINQDLNQQYTKFNSYFIKEVNKKGNKILDIQSPIKLGDKESDDAQNITGCVFTTNEEENGKITVTVIIQGENFERETTYTLVE